MGQHSPPPPCTPSGFTETYFVWSVGHKEKIWTCSKKSDMQYVLNTFKLTATNHKKCYFYDQILTIRWDTTTTQIWSLLLLIKLSLYAPFKCCDRLYGLLSWLLAFPYKYVFRYVYYTRAMSLIPNEQVYVCFWFLIECHMYNATL